MIRFYPREGQIRTTWNRKKEFVMTDGRIRVIEKERRWRDYIYLRTPMKVRIRHFFQDLLRKYRK